VSAAQPVPHVGVVVLNFNGREDTIACLDSLSASTWPRLTTIVIDNASDTDIGPEVRARYPEAITFATTSNLGFAGGMNAGVECAQAIGADYVLLLNNDTVVDRLMVEKLVEAAEARPDAGIVSPLVLGLGTRDRVLSAGWAFDPRRGHPGRPLHAGDRADGLHGVEETVASSGEAMLVSASALEQVGRLDETLFCRLEDIDWSLRMQAAGRTNYLALEARLWHAVSASSGGDHSPLSAYYHTRNMLVVCERHAPLPRPRALAREAEVLIANIAHARRGTHPAHNARAALVGWRDCRLGRLGAR
jgi:GT2 family glycosyltransferase